MPQHKIRFNHTPSGFSGDSVGAYLKEISQFPLLTHDEEITYGRQVQQMMDLLNRKDTLENDGPITQVEWAKDAGLNLPELKQIMRQGQRAKQKMIRANLRLVVSIAKKYTSRNLELLDLIQEGSVGLHRGVEKFDPGQGYRFSTYAYWWIRQAITRAIAQQARTIRLPIHIIEKLNKIKKVQRRLAQTLGRKATPEEIAAELNMKPDKVRYFLKVARPVFSLDKRVGEKQDTDLIEILEDDGLSPNDYVSHELLAQDLRDAMMNLTPRAREVLLLRFGLEGEPPMTLVAVANRLRISRERVRKLQQQALFYLRKHHRADLQAYLAS